MSINIVYPSEKYYSGYREALNIVAQERIYLDMTEAPPLDKVIGFQSALVAKNGPVYYAVHEDRVVGWCDVFPFENPHHRHRGGLGMGIVPEFRGQGIGSRLVAAVVDHTRKFGLEKIELKVYTSNTAGVALYRKMGFSEEGLIKNYRKVDGQSFDALCMALFL